MAQATNIEWTDAVWNPVTGCTKVSPGCKNCYAETIANRFWKDRKFTDVKFHEDRLGQPLHWKKPRMIFVNSMSDLFHEDVSFTFVDKVFEVIRDCTQHIFQILTKRPERMKEYMEQWDCFSGFPSGNFPGEWDNLWMGISVENQKTADERIPILLETPAAVRWISAEPLLGHINLENYIYWINTTKKNIPKLDWVVAGGESGPKARYCDIGWIYDIVEKCKVSKTPVFVKQLGTNIRDEWNWVPKEMRKGKNDDIKCFPEGLKIRQYPKIIGV